MPSPTAGGMDEQREVRQRYVSTSGGSGGLGKSSSGSGSGSGELSGGGAVAKADPAVEETAEGLGNLHV